jgi:hypothetical protein
MNLYRVLSLREIHRQSTQVNCDDLVSMQHNRKWFRGFESGRKDVHVDERTTRPITSGTDAKAARVEKRILVEQKSHSLRFYSQIPQRISGNDCECLQKKKTDSFRDVLFKGVPHWYKFIHVVCVWAAN